MPAKIAFVETSGIRVAALSRGPAVGLPMHLVTLVVRRVATYRTWRKTRAGQIIRKGLATVD